MTPTIYSFLFLLFVYYSECVESRYYPRYHLAPPKGWMNDPNGFCIFKDEYHLFYQYNPYSSQEPGIAHWGHAKSKDLFNWEHLPIAMYPDMDYDKDGVFSGSAIIENGTMYLFYTGNVNHPGQTPDHEQHQILAWSNDGVTVTKYEHNPNIEGTYRQPNFRDPKVWKHEDTFYMVLGNSYNNDTLGRALLYSSKDLYSWKEVSILDKSEGSLGYMWECPDFFELNGHFILLISPQGIKPEGIKYKNLYQTGYLVGKFDYKTGRFTRLTEFRQLDSGHDFYATQTIKDKCGRRIMMAWLDMWEEVYPERDEGFTGCMTIPRDLTLDDNLRLIQRPVEQIKDAIGNMLYTGKAYSDTVIKLENNTGKIEARAPSSRDFTLILESSGKTSLTITFTHESGLVTLDRGGDDGERSVQWRPEGLEELRWTLYVDSSSVELFLGDGEVTFTSRFFPDGVLNVRIGEESEANVLTVHAMKQTVPSPTEEK